jgi:Domain of unknown function (DUF4389)
MSVNPPADTVGSGSQGRELLARLLYMIVFGLAFWVSSILLGLAAILQLLTVAFTGARNDNLTSFGGALAEYVRAVVRYLTFVTDTPPFPFTNWPASSETSEQ